jgi:hypothetical protein
MRFLRNEMLLLLPGTAIHKKQMTSGESSVDRSGSFGAKYKSVYLPNEVVKQVAHWYSTLLLTYVYGAFVGLSFKQRLAGVFFSTKFAATRMVRYISA